jgi:hypothetical protein
VKRAVVKPTSELKRSATSHPVGDGDRYSNPKIDGKVNHHQTSET